jgi:hypothetical protein
LQAPTYVSYNQVPTNASSIRYQSSLPAYKQMGHPYFSNTTAEEKPARPIQTVVPRNERSVKYSTRGGLEDVLGSIVRHLVSVASVDSFDSRFDRFRLLGTRPCPRPYPLARTATGLIPTRFPIRRPCLVQRLYRSTLLVMRFATRSTQQHSEFLGDLLHHSSRCLRKAIASSGLMVP